MKHQEIDGLMKTVAPIIGGFVLKAIAPLIERLQKLESRVPAKDGTDGKDGRDGVDGKDGSPGEKGADGKDGPTIEDLEALIEKKFATLPKIPVNQLIDARGNLVSIFEDGEAKIVGMVRGNDGPCGESVMDCSINEEGILYLHMSGGRKIRVGKVRGENGLPGETIKGPPGRDANEINILFAIDENKSYPEGVYARWRGGVIRANRQTDSIADGNISEAGWITIHEGIASESEEILDDGRVIERTTIYTSGKVWKRQFKTATILDQGVWKEKTYDRGDTVSLAGSMFIAQRDTLATDKPEQSDAWRLSVKRGRNGSDGKLKDTMPKQVKI